MRSGVYESVGEFIAVAAAAAPGAERFEPVSGNEGDVTVYRFRRIEDAARAGRLWSGRDDLSPAARPPRVEA